MIDSGERIRYLFGFNCKGRGKRKTVKISRFGQKEWLGICAIIFKDG